MLFFIFLKTWAEFLQFSSLKIKVEIQDCCSGTSTCQEYGPLLQPTKHELECTRLMDQSANALAQNDEKWPVKVDFYGSDAPFPVFLPVIGALNDISYSTGSVFLVGQLVSSEFKTCQEICNEIIKVLIHSEISLDHLLLYFDDQGVKISFSTNFNDF